MFEPEFEGLPRDVEQALRERLESVIRVIRNRYHQSLHGEAVNYTNEQLTGMIASIFDVAERMKPFKAPDTE